LVNSTYFLLQFCYQNKEIVSSFINFQKLSISQRKISVQPFPITIGGFLNDFGGWKIKIILVILYRILVKQPLNLVILLLKVLVILKLNLVMVPLFF
jgi:hypothetical protein